MQAKIEITVTVTTDDGLIQTRQLAGDLRPPRLLDVTVFGGVLLGACVSAIEEGKPVDHPQIVQTIASAKAQCERGVQFGPPPGRR